MLQAGNSTPLTYTRQCRKLGQSIGAWIQKKDKTQAKVAELLGLHKSTISKMLNGSRGIDVIELVELANVLDSPVSIEELIEFISSRNDLT